MIYKNHLYDLIHMSNVMPQNPFSLHFTSEKVSTLINFHHIETLFNALDAFPSTIVRRNLIWIVICRPWAASSSFWELVVLFRSSPLHIEKATSRFWELTPNGNFHGKYQLYTSVRSFVVCFIFHLFGTKLLLARSSGVWCLNVHENVKRLFKAALVLHSSI